MFSRMSITAQDARLAGRAGASAEQADHVPGDFVETIRDGAGVVVRVTGQTGRETAWQTESSGGGDNNSRYLLFIHDDEDEGGEAREVDGALWQ